MNHLDLFSGIGGFALAADYVWREEHSITAFVEIDKYCQRVLKYHWPDVPIIEDIRDVSKEALDNAIRRRSQTINENQTWSKNDQRIFEETGGQTRIDLLTGGFPCQPFSQAGRRQGKKDERYLWPEMYRVIRETLPNWIIAENVVGIISLGLEHMLADLAGLGYEVEVFIIPAAGVNAPHRRDRVWIVSHRYPAGQSDRVEESGWSEASAGAGIGSIGGRGYSRALGNSPGNGFSIQSSRSGRGDNKGEQAGKKIGKGLFDQALPAGQDVADSDPNGCICGKTKKQSEERGKQAQYESCSCGERVYREGFSPNSAEQRLEGHSRNESGQASSGIRSQGHLSAGKDMEHTKDNRRQHSIHAEGKKISGKQKDRNAVEGNRICGINECGEYYGRWATQSRLGLLADGFSQWMAEPAGIPRITKEIKERVNKLKALGNAIVPQTIIPILLAIKTIDDNETIHQ